jgi:hypothetical protein
MGKFDVHRARSKHQLEWYSRNGSVTPTAVDFDLLGSADRLSVTRFFAVTSSLFRWL